MRLHELGWQEGRNVRIDYRFGEGNTANLPKFAKELVELRPDVIVAATTPAAIALRQQTLSIAIVFVQVPDPVAAGFVTNLAHPEGNISGFPNVEFSIGGKWLQIIKDCAPKTSRVAVLFDPANPSWTAYVRSIEAAAPKFEVQLAPAGVRNAAEIEHEIAQFASAPNGALIVLPAPVTVFHRHVIISSATRHRLPAIYPYSYFATAGGLMSYGVDLNDTYRRAADYVDRILKGARPVDLPVQLPNRFELIVNLKTAKTLGITVGPSLLQLADKVIE